MKNFKKYFIYCCGCFILSSCQFKCSMGSGKADPKNASTTPVAEKEKEGTTITNNIVLQTEGFKIKKATLLLPNDSRVPDDNTVSLNQKIKLMLYIDEGWKLRNGRVFPGAAEKITTDDGTVLADTEDLFASETSQGYTELDTKAISLTAVVTELGKDVKYYKVSFRVWDKNGPGEVSGFYKFYVR